jgi:hypothetical protein
MQSLISIPTLPLTGVKNKEKILKNIEKARKTLAFFMRM